MDPPLPHFQQQLMALFDMVAHALSTFPRIETQLPGVAARITGNYRMPPPQDVTVAALRDSVARAIAQTELAVQRLADSYAALLPQLDEDIVKDALSADRGLKHLQQAIDGLRAANTQVGERTVDRVDCGLVVVDTTGLKDAVAARAADRIARLLDSAASAARAMCLGACDRFKAVADRAVQRPGSSEELIDVKGYVDGAERIVEDIMQEVGRIRTQLVFLLDNAYSLTETDSSLFTKTFTWPARLGMFISTFCCYFLYFLIPGFFLCVAPILDDARVRLSGQLENFENELRVRRENYESVRLLSVSLFSSSPPAVPFKHFRICLLVLFLSLVVFSDLPDFFSILKRLWAESTHSSPWAPSMNSRAPLTRSLTCDAF